MLNDEELEVLLKITSALRLASDAACTDSVDTESSFTETFTASPASKHSAAPHPPSVRQLLLGWQVSNDLLPFF